MEPLVDMEPGRRPAALAPPSPEPERSAGATPAPLIGSWERDLARGAMSWSPALTEILGLPADYRPSFEAIVSRAHPLDRGTLRREMQRALDRGCAFSLDHRVVRSDGAVRQVRHVATVRTDEHGAPTSVLGFVEDVTDAAARVGGATASRLDALTSLPERDEIVARLERAIEWQQEFGGTVAILHIDIDRFKVVNETLGRALGDRLLRSFAERLGACLSRGEIVGRGTRGASGSSLGRLSGDEFVVLLAPIEQPEEPARVAQKLLDALSRPFVVGGHERFLTASIGIAVQPPDGPRAEELLQHAETALAHAKRAGRRTFRFYTERMNAAVVRRLDIETELYYALERRQLAVVYQPLVDARDGRAVGVEALLRWQHPRLGEVTPTEFVPVAEDTGVIVEIGEWVLETACEQMRRWRDAGLEGLRLSVNLSVRQLQEGGVPQLVAGVLKRTGVTPDGLQLEITERGVQEISPAVLEQLVELRAMGVRLAVDDFGTGVSALGCLRRLPLDVLKIDGALVGSMPDDRGAASIIAAVIAMAHTLCIEVVAEGIETAGQLEFLTNQGCEQGQGFLFAPALAPAAAESWLRDAGYAPEPDAAA